MIIDRDTVSIDEDSWTFSDVIFISQYFSEQKINFSFNANVCKFMYSSGLSAKNKLPSAQNGEVVHYTDIEGTVKRKWEKTATSCFSPQHPSPLEDEYPASGDETDYEATVGGQTLQRTN